MALHGSDESKRMADSSGLTIVSIIGRKGSGKNTAADLLIKEYGFKEYKFADPLKNMLREYYRYCGLDSNEIERRIEGDRKESPDKYLRGKTPRHAMQTLGTEWRDTISPDLWAYALRDNISKLPPGARVVITDNRFPHECDVLDVLFSPIYVRIFRKQADENPDMHPSERSLDNMHYHSVIHNDYSIERLEERMRQIMKINNIGKV